MRKINAPILLMMLLLGAITLRAQATRTWISGVGDDANPCSRTAPCKTFAGAISKTAAKGEIDVLDPGGFGGITITKSITLDGGEGQVGSVLVSGTNGITVSAGGSDIVTLRNLTINGIAAGTNGIQVNSVGMLHIEHCTIKRFLQNGINIQLNSGGSVDVQDTISTDNIGSGIRVSGSGSNIAGATINRSRFADNNNGVFATDSSVVTVIDSVASDNSIGFVAQGSGGLSNLYISNSSASDNGTGILAGGSTAISNVRIAGVSIFSNGTGLTVGASGNIYSFGNNYNTDGGATPSSINPE